MVLGEEKGFRRERAGRVISRDRPMWVSDVLPGNVNDLSAARKHVLAVLRPFVEAMPVLADAGYEGAGHGVRTSVKKRPA